MLKLHGQVLIEEQVRSSWSLSILLRRRLLQQLQHELAIVIEKDDLGRTVSLILKVRIACISQMASTYLFASRWNTRILDPSIHILRTTDVLLSLHRRNRNQHTSRRTAVEMTVLHLSLISASCNPYRWWRTYLIFWELQLLQESRIFPVPTTSFASDILITVFSDSP